MTQTTMLACRNARDARWQLGDVPAGGDGWTLFGWRQQPSATDAGIPAEVAAALADALSSVARVTFPCSTERVSPTGDWVPRGVHHVRTLAAEGVADIIRSKLKHEPRDLVLLSTRDAAAIVRLFEDVEYPWWLQGTLVLLSDPESPPPDVDRQQFVALLRGGPSADDLQLVNAAVSAVLRPGVDGDVAGLLSRDATFVERFVGAAGRACSARGIAWSVVTEQEFTAGLA